MQAAEQLLAYEVVHDGLDREAWLHARAFGVGASEVPILFGLVSWCDPLTLYAQKRGEVRKEEQGDTQLLDWGNDCQESIIRYMQRRTGETIRSNTALLRSVEYPWLVATPDAITASGDPCEVKAQTFGYDEGEWTDGIPQKFAIQCQAQMIVMGKQRCLFGASIWGKPPVWCWYLWDDVLARQIIAKTRRFWQQVQGGTPPESDGSELARKTALALAKRVPETTELYTGEIEDLITEWQTNSELESSTRALAEQHKKKRKAAEDELILKMGSAERAVTSDGWVFLKQKTEKRGYTVKPSTQTTFKVIPPEEQDWSHRLDIK